MDISPCLCVVTLSTGENHTLFKFQDFLELVDEKMGMGARGWLEERVEKLEEATDYTMQAVDTDLSGYEMALDSNRDAFEDIRYQARDKGEMLLRKRCNRAIMVFIEK